MADDVTLKVLVEPDLKELENKAKMVNVSPATKANLEHAKKKADIALESGDIKAFKNYINKYIDILKNAVANMPGINKEFIALQKRLGELVKALPDITTKKAAIEGKFVRGDVSKGKYTKEASITALSKAGVANPEEAYKKLAEVMNLTGNNWSKLTNQMAQSLNSTKEELRKFRDIVHTAASEDQKEYRELDKAESANAKEQNEIKEDLKNLGPVSEEDAKGLNALYESLIQLQKALNQKSGYQARKQSGSGGGGSTEGIDTSSLTSGVNKQSSSFGKVFRQFTIYHFALRSMKKALKEAVQTVKELDRALTEQAMVTGLTRKQTYDLLSTYQDMSSRLGATTKEVSSTMTQFLRQGRSITESLKLTEAAVSAAKVAGISAADSINYLTTAINGFRLSADDAMKVSDKFAAVAASAATSYEEIAIALSKVAAQANLAGMSIDYTTALLTKGIETTREAPETIGTALKTVIARMRELSDYGETLEGDMDINNVESQLAYIGIALRDNNGELRSTEDVLNDLGGMWDDLNANQQAAIAKALAGTRQQSRLIAMMSDYERVIELQQISERSAGATMAQMATYMEGMDAALNKINVAWEKIVSSVVDNEFIIGLVNWFGEVLDYVGTLFEKTEAIIPIIMILITKGVEYLGVKLQEQKVARETMKYNAEMSLKKIQQEKAEQKALIQKLQTYTANKKAEIKLEKETTLQKLKDQKNLGQITEAEYNKKVKQTNDAAAAAEKAADEYDKTIQEQLQTENEKLKVLEAEEVAAQGQINRVGELSQAFSGFAGVLSDVGSKIKNVVTAVPQLINAFKAAKASSDAAGGGLRATSAAYIPVIGWAISLILMGISVVSIIANAVSALGEWIEQNKKEEPADRINNLAASIYNLNKKSNTLETVISKFDKLDNKIIKTNEDIEEMNTLLDSAADTLSDEEKEDFQKLSSAQEKKAFLQRVKDNTNYELSKARSEQKDIILNAKREGGSEWEYYSTSGDSKAAVARDSMYALNNTALYNYIDLLKEEATLSEDAALATEKLTQSLLEKMDVEKAASLLENPEKIAEYIDTIHQVLTEATDVDGKVKQLNAALVLTSDDYSIKDRAEAYRDLYKNIKDLGDQELIDAFEAQYSAWKTFANMSNEALGYIDKIGASVSDINDMGDAIQKLGYDSQQATIALESLFEEMANGIGLTTALIDTFDVAFGSEEYTKLLNAFDKAVGTTVLNMGQNIDKFRNSIDSVYEKATQWGEMSETDKTQFLSEHADMFKGDSGAKLLHAFESGDYALINAALSTNDALLKQREQLISDVNRQIEIELARAADERDYAYIRELEQYRDELADVENLFLASLKLRQEQQDKQLAVYKEYLQKEADALTESLNKRKDAYSKYFQEINQEAEDEDYEENANKLIENISKLSSSQNADAKAKEADLTRQLEELNKERLETLRERAQEAVIQNIDDQVAQINDNLEKLLDNEQALLNAMMQDMSNPTDFIASLMASKAATGANSDLTMQSYLKEMQATFESIMPDTDWNQVEVQRQGDNVILNIAGQEVVLTDNDQKTIYEAIYDALRQIGKN